MMGNLGIIVYISNTYWVILVNVINFKVDNFCFILSVVMYEIIMCSENWFEIKSISFILKIFWEYYIIVWVEICFKIVWFFYIEKWFYRDRYKFVWFMEWILNWDYRY